MPRASRNAWTCRPISSTFARSRVDRVCASAPRMPMPAGMGGSPCRGSSPPQGRGVLPTTYWPSPAAHG
eukprot:4335913-Prymnesium_polylepis.1